MPASTATFGCGDCTSWSDSLGCCHALFCAPCQFSSVVSKFTGDEMACGQRPRCAGACSFLLSPLCVFSQCFLLSCPLNYMARTAFNESVASKEHCVSTVCISALCGTCSNAQILREMGHVSVDGATFGLQSKTLHGGPPRLLKMSKRRPEHHESGVCKYCNN